MFEPGDQSIYESDRLVVAFGDPQRPFEVDDLCDACHFEQGRDRWAHLGGDSGIGERAGDRIELYLPDTVRVAENLGADRLALVCQRHELNSENSSGH